MSNDALGITAEGAYYAADNQYRCEYCGRPMRKGGELKSTKDGTSITQICRCGKKLVLKYGRR